MLLVVCIVTEIVFPYYLLFNFFFIEILLIQNGVTKKENDTTENQPGKLTKKRPKMKSA